MPQQPDFTSKLNTLIQDHVHTLVAEISRAVRQNIATQLGSFLESTPGAGRAVASPAKAAPKRKLAARRVKKQIVGCIAPSCGNPSKGPRFHYLCEKHKDAPQKDYQAWRKSKTAKA